MFTNKSNQMEKHQINLPESEIQMLIAEYDNKLSKIVKPLQRFETGIEICRYLADEKNLKIFYLEYGRRVFEFQ